MATSISAVAAAQSVFDFTRREPVFVIQFCCAFAAIAMGVDLLNHLLGLEDQTFTTDTGQTELAGARAEILKGFAETPWFKLAGSIALSAVVFTLFVANGLRKMVLDEYAEPLGFRVGADELRILAGTMLLGLLGLGIPLGTLGSLFLYGDSLGLMLTAVLFLVFLLLFAVAGFYLTIRLSQWGVAIIANKALAPLQWASMTRGIFWSLAGAYALWVLGSLITSAVLATLGGLVAPLFSFGLPPVPDEPGAIPTPFEMLAVYFLALFEGFILLANLGIGAYVWRQREGSVSNDPEPALVEA